MDNKNVSKLMIGFFMLIIGIIFIGIIANSSAAVTGKFTVVNESVSIATARNLTGTTCNINSTVSINITNGPTDWKIIECPVTNLVMRAENGTLLTSTTDYTFTASTGALVFLNTYEVNQTCESNVTTADYNYCQDDYLVEGWSRSIMDLIAGFMALATIGIALGLFYSIAKDENILKN